MRFGYCVNMIARDEYRVGYAHIERLKALGFDYIDLAIAQMMDMPMDVFKSEILDRLHTFDLPCVCVNNLFPASLRLTGPEADHAAVLEYTRRAFERAAMLGASRAVFGSSGARNVPFGFSHEEATQQLVDVLQALDPIAAQYGITFVIEPLNRSESNILTSLAESAELCRRAACPQTKMLIDSYHMALSGETAADIACTTGTLRHAHMARPLGRGLPLPGDGEDYAALFRAMRAAGYDDAVSIEAYIPDDIDTLLPISLAYLHRCAE